MHDLNKSSMDIFSSFALSMEHLGGMRTSKPSSYFNNIFENNKEIEAELGKLEK